MSEKTMTVTEAARNFSRIIRRAERRVSTLLVKNGKPIARVIPVESNPQTTHSFAAAWPKMRHLTPAEAESFAEDLEADRKSLPPLVSPWDKS